MPSTYTPGSRPALLLTHPPRGVRTLLPTSPARLSKAAPRRSGLPPPHTTAPRGGEGTARANNRHHGFDLGLTLGVVWFFACLLVCLFFLPPPPSKKTNKTNPNLPTLSTHLRERPASPRLSGRFCGARAGAARAAVPRPPGPQRPLRAARSGARGARTPDRTRLREAAQRQPVLREP